MYAASLAESGLVNADDFDAAWDMPAFVEATLVWLSNCEYIFLREGDVTLGDTTYYATLAPRAFDSMRQKSPLDPSKTLGESFRTVVSEKSWKGLGIIVTTALSSSVSNVLSSGG